MPVLRLQIYTVRYCAHVSEEFDQADLQTVFERFGVIKELHVDKNVAYMRFDNFVSAYLALQTLNDF